MIATARMYAVNATAAAAWRTLLEWVFARSELDCTVIDHPPPQPLSALWARSDLACAFMCGYPLAQASPMPVILAAPVPNPAAYSHAPVYWTEIVTRADAAIAGIEDIFGRRFAYTIEDSQSGYQAPRAFFAQHARNRGGRVFAATVGPLATPRRVIEAVLNGEADAGPVDSYALDLIRAHEPELASRLITIARTPPTPIPPLIATHDIAPDHALRLRRALLAVAVAPELASVRAALLLERFAEASMGEYSVLLDRAHAADAMGYPRLA